MVTERILQRRALRREEFGAAFGDVHIVLRDGCQFSADVDAGLVTGGHVGREFGGVAANQIRPLVAIHAMPWPRRCAKYL